METEKTFTADELSIIDRALTMYRHALYSNYVAYRKHKREASAQSCMNEWRRVYRLQEFKMAEFATKEERG